MEIKTLNDLEKRCHANNTRNNASTPMFDRETVIEAIYLNLEQQREASKWEGILAEYERKWNTAVSKNLSYKKQLANHLAAIEEDVEDTRFCEMLSEIGPTLALALRVKGNQLAR